MLIALLRLKQAKSILMELSKGRGGPNGMSWDKGIDQVVQLIQKKQLYMNKLTDKGKALMVGPIHNPSTDKFSRQTAATLSSVTMTNIS